MVTNLSYLTAILVLGVLVITSVPGLQKWRMGHCMLCHLYLAYTQIRLKSIQRQVLEKLYNLDMATKHQNNDTFAVISRFKKNLNLVQYIIFSATQTAL